MQKIVALCKRRGFVFPGSELYGGLNGTWDLGPLGVILANNIKNEWWKNIVLLRDDVVGLDSAILHHPKVWEASGHIYSFTDPLVECSVCNARFRTDHLIKYPKYYRAVLAEADEYVDRSLKVVEEIHQNVKNLMVILNKLNSSRNLPSLTSEEKKVIEERARILNEIIDDELKKGSKKLEEIGLVIKETAQYKRFRGFLVKFLYLDRMVFCPVCGSKNWSTPKDFNLMFKTHLGPVEESGSLIYLRPETAQGIFINFQNVLDTTRLKIPFGIAQIGKGFRNEITTGNFLFRVREFEMMELEFFVRPGEGEKQHQYWKEERLRWYIDLGINKENIKIIDLPKEELAHYSKGTAEIWYKWPFMGFGELEGVANRGDYDLKRHSEYSGKKLEVVDPVGAEGIETPMPPYTPYVIEPSVGVGRAMLAFLIDAYSEDGKRIVLKLHPKLAPYKVAVFPLLANKPELVKLAREIYVDLRKGFMVAWDERGNIGGRYASQDEIGTPFCVTVDFQSLEDEMVTVRDRDTTKQDRVKMVDLKQLLSDKLI
ncbi:glycine--tRNA ligase [Candidatus Daviesbacteria bacterium]|nr:glycine--tRNA ligase [Candidatus Daviesbacteria bacterium]